MADSQLSAAAADGESETRTPQLAPTLDGTSMKCCCGSPECVYLRHNCAILNNVEKDVHQAARMGQALLARHESYMANAERDRTELTARVEHLEHENKELETRNAKMAEENKDLLAQLEALNTTIFDTEVHMKSLEATLVSSQQTVRRLELETARAEALERQIASLEQEQAEIQGTLLLSREEARSAVSRWKRAERGISDLQKQLERIEKEAKQEREHHMEMMERLEKQREMEKELNTAAGRLKGAAAAKFMAQGNGGGNVVGHFVRDLLQDNANLQCGIAELREMLMNANNEIQSLRDQLEYHQPLGEIEASTTPTLRAELELKQQRPNVSQALHIHHHYHVASHRQDIRKPKKKRPGLTGGVFSPPSFTDPSTPPNGASRYATAPRSRKNSVFSNRWSTYSEQQPEFSMSPDPSSPRSNRRNSVFDLPPGSSFPGSPSSSVDPLSPEWQPSHKRMPSNMSTRSFHAPAYFSFGQANPNISHPIVEESDGSEIPAGFSSAAEQSDDTDEETSPHGLGVIQNGGPSVPDTSAPIHKQSVASLVARGLQYKSMASTPSNFDVRILKSRPTQITIRQLRSASTITASSIVIARPLLLRDNVRRGSVVLRDSFGSLPVGSFPSDVSAGSPPRPSEPSKLTKWVLWRPWKKQPRGSNSSRAPHSAPATAQTPKAKAARKRPNRLPGINQPGAVPGFAEYLAAAATKKKGPVGQITAGDNEVLGEGLSE